MSQAPDPFTVSTPSPFASPSTSTAAGSKEKPTKRFTKRRCYRCEIQKKGCKYQDRFLDECEGESDETVLGTRCDHCQGFVDRCPTNQGHGQIEIRKENFPWFCGWFAPKLAQPSVTATNPMIGLRERIRKINPHLTHIPSDRFSPPMKYVTDSVSGSGISNFGSPPVEAGSSAGDPSLSASWTAMADPAADPQTSATCSWAPSNLTNDLGYLQGYPSSTQTAQSGVQIVGYTEPPGSQPSGPSLQPPFRIDYTQPNANAQSQNSTVEPDFTFMDQFLERSSTMTNNDNQQWGYSSFDAPSEGSTQLYATLPNPIPTRPRAGVNIASAGELSVQEAIQAQSATDNPGYASVAQPETPFSNANTVIANLGQVQDRRKRPRLEDSPSMDPSLFVAEQSSVTCAHAISAGNNSMDITKPPSETDLNDQVEVETLKGNRNSQSTVDRTESHGRRIIEVFHRTQNAVAEDIRRCQSKLSRVFSRILSSFGRGSSDDQRAQSGLVRNTEALADGLETYLDGRDHLDTRRNSPTGHKLMVEGSERMAKSGLRINQSSRELSVKARAIKLNTSQAEVTPHSQAVRQSHGTEGMTLSRISATDIVPAVSAKQYADWNDAFFYPSSGTDNSGNTGLHLAVYHGLMQFFILMIQNSEWKPLVEQQNIYGETALVIAAEKNRPDYVLGLRVLNALPDGRPGERKTTALHRAVQLGNVQVVKALFADHRASPHEKGQDDRESPYELAKNSANMDPDIRDLLLGHDRGNVYDRNDLPPQASFSEIISYGMQNKT